MSDPELRALYARAQDFERVGDYRSALRLFQEIRSRMTAAHSPEQYAAVDEAIAVMRAQLPTPVWPWVVGGALALGVGYWAYRRLA